MSSSLLILLSSRVERRGPIRALNSSALNPLETAFSRMQLSMTLTARPQAMTASVRASLRDTQRATTTLIARSSSATSPRLASVSARRQSRPRLLSPVAAASGSNDAVTGAWLDLASFITGSSGKKGGPYEELADAIGEFFRGFSFEFFFLLFRSFFAALHLSLNPSSRSLRIPRNNNKTKQARPPMSMCKGGTCTSGT